MQTIDYEQSQTPQIRFEPFIDPTQPGNLGRITSGDTVTCTYVAPDATTGTVALTRNATTKIWSGALGAAFQAGEWQFIATSSAPNNPDFQYLILRWGVGIYADIPSIKTTVTTMNTTLNSAATNILTIEASTNNLPLDPASQATTLAEINAARDSIKGSGTPDIATAITNIESAIQGTGAHTIADLFSQGGTTQTTVNTINTGVAEVQTDTDTLITTANAIKAKTDNLPTTPAAQSDVTTVGTAVAAVQTTVNEIATDTDTTITTANAIKAKTDNLPATPAAQSDVTTVGTAVASVQTTATNALAQATLARQVATNRQVVDEAAKTLTVMNDGHGNNTPLLVFDLIDKNGSPTSGNMLPTDVHERNPH